MIFNPLHIPLILYGGAAGPLPRAGSGLRKAGNFSAEGSLTAGLRRGQSAAPRHHLWSSRGYISRAGGRKGGGSVLTPPDGPVCRREFISLTPDPHLCSPQNGFKQRLFLAALAPTKCESREAVSVWDVFSRRGQQSPTMPQGREYQAKASSGLVSILGAFLCDFLIRSKIQKEDS